MREYFASTSKMVEHVQGFGHSMLHLGKLFILFAVMLCNPDDAKAQEPNHLLDAKTLSASDIETAALSILPNLDEFYGGYGVASKFPREASFLFLLDQAERTANPDLLFAVTNMLDGMILGGIHDHVGGGFHRFAIDPEWRTSHFEKMLYTQALTGRLLIRAWSATGEARYRRVAERLFDYVLRDLRDPAGGFYASQTDQKIILSWNTLMITTLAEASYRLDNPDYYEAAQSAANYVLTEMSGTDGLKRVGFQGSVQGAAQLADYAAFGLALVALYDYAPTRKSSTVWLDSAEKVAREMSEKLSIESGGFKMVEVADGLTEVIPLDDTMIPSGNGLALSLLSHLKSRTRVPLYGQTSERLARTVSEAAITDPSNHSSLLTAIAEVISGSSNSVRYGSGGAVRVEFIDHPDTTEFEILLTVADGWHVNAHLPMDDYLIPTSLTLDVSANIDTTYPSGTIKSLSFNEAPLALYEGAFSLRANKAKELLGRPTKAILTFQACSDEVCLPPEEMTFVLW